MGSQEAVRTSLAVQAGGQRFDSLITDLGYDVQLSDARVMVANISFLQSDRALTATLEAERGRPPLARTGGLDTPPEPRPPFSALAHGFSEQILRWFVPHAHAHAGHDPGGVVSGELSGRHLVCWVRDGGEVLGNATMFPGTFREASLTLDAATASDGIALSDPLLGHTAILRGQARRDGATVAFVFLLDSTTESRIDGVQFDAQVAADSDASIQYRLSLTGAPLSGSSQRPTSSIFDGIDFAALALSSRDVVTLSEDTFVPAIRDAYLRIATAFHRHEHHSLKLHVP